MHLHSRHFLHEAYSSFVGKMKRCVFGESLSQAEETEVTNLFLSKILFETTFKAKFNLM